MHRAKGCLFAYDRPHLDSVPAVRIDVDPLELDDSRWQTYGTRLFDPGRM